MQDRDLLELDCELGHNRLDRRRRQAREHLAHLLRIELRLARIVIGTTRRPPPVPPGESG